MTPQELKYSIIFLALQGKLVGQDKDDSPVDLSGIKSKNTEECEFDIPDSWGLAHLETVTNGIPSKQYQILESEVQQTGRYPVISQSKAYSIGFSDDFDKVYHHTKPVIVFGDHTTEVKHVEFDFVVGADGVKIFEPIDGIVTADFLFYVFLFYSKDLSKVGGYSRHYKFIKNKPVPLPPLAEQKRIVAKIEELLPLIDRYEQAWSRLEDFNKRFPVDMQKAILQMAIQGKLVPQRPEEGTGEELFQQIQAEKQALIKSGKIKKEKPLPEIAEDEIPFDIPESWKWVRLESILHAINAGKSFKCHEMAPDDRQAGVVKVSSVTWGEFDENESKTCFSEDNWIEEYAIQTGDFLLSRANTKKLVGACVIVRNISKRLMLSDKILRLTFSSSVSKDYILFCLRSPIVRAQIEATATGTSDSMKNISQNDIRQYRIPLPPLAEQKRIVAKLEEILPLCERLK